MKKFKSCKNFSGTKMYSTTENLLKYCYRLNVYVNSLTCWIGCPYYDERY